MTNKEKEILFSRTWDYRNDYVSGKSKFNCGLIALTGLIRELGLNREYLLYIRGLEKERKEVA